jgi:hypothetical protein
MARHPGEFVAKQRLDFAGHVIGTVANLKNATDQDGGAIVTRGGAKIYTGGIAKSAVVE